jgi:hypothetical protein
MWLNVEPFFFFLLVLLFWFAAVHATQSWQIIYGRNSNGQTLASGVLRADMLQSFVEAELRLVLDEPAARCSSVDAQLFMLEQTPVDVCVCAKCNGLMVEELCAHCHARGGRFVWEVVDLAGQLSYVDLVHACCDLWLVSNRVAAAQFLQHGAKATAVVHHHHTNVDNIRSPCRSQAAVRVVASTASKANTPVEFERDLATILSRDGVEFRSLVSPFYLDHPSAENGWNQVQFHDGLDDVDVAVIWPPVLDAPHLTFRPITRLAHWWSHGIPVIWLRSIDTYREVCEELGVGMELACDHLECVVERIRQLSDEPEMRCRMAEQVLAASRRFNVTSSAAAYVRAILHG